MLALLLLSQLQAATVVVNQSGGEDALGIQEGLDLLNDGDTLLIRAGVYYESSLSTLATGVVIMGEGADVTLLESPDPTEDHTGLTARGNVTVSDMGFRGFSGAAVYADRWSEGGGIGVFERCVFEDNIIGISLYNGESELYVYDSTFVGHERGVHAGTSVGVHDVHLENNLFVDIYYYAIRLGDEEFVVSHGTTHDIVHNVFIDNLVAFMRNAGHSDVAQVNVANNVFQSGDYVYVVGDYELPYTSFHNNLIGDTMGVEYPSSGAAIPDSADNVTGDPLFVDFSDDGDWTNDDLRLLPGSPAVDMGSAKAPSTAATDRDGTTRPLDGDWDGTALPDAGAYELNPDEDDDGHGSLEVGGDDCDDADATIHPDAEDICEDGLDQDCDGKDAPCVTDTGDTGPPPLDTADSTPPDTGDSLPDSPVGNSDTEVPDDTGEGDGKPGCPGCTTQGQPLLLLLPLLLLPAVWRRRETFPSRAGGRTPS